MNLIKRLSYRLYQKVLYVAAFFLDFKEPHLIIKEDTGEPILEILDYHRVKRVLFITDTGIAKIGLHERLVNLLKKYSKEVFVYDKTVPNPTIDNIEEAFELYKTNACQAIIAFGGGSAIDCAKGVGARVARPKKSIAKMKGLLKVGRKIPLLIAIPTTAGTGSEATLACVVTNSRTHEKYAINDPVLIPHYALLDASLTFGLPPAYTAAPGMDALTHAVEAYIGQSNTHKTRTEAMRAIKLIYNNLYTAYVEPKNLLARKSMQQAAYSAGLAFTRAYVGYVHCIAHTLGGFYNVPHGLANAVILPLVLRKYGQKIERPLSELCDWLKLTTLEETNHNKALKFIGWIEEMNAKMMIPKSFGSIIKSEDIPLMIKRAISEGNPTYPVPVIWDESDLREIYDIIGR